MQIEKHWEVAFLGYFGLLLLLVVSNMELDMNIINIIYLIVVLSCMLKFVLIVNNVKK